MSSTSKFLPTGSLSPEPAAPADRGLGRTGRCLPPARPPLRQGAGAAAARPRLDRRSQVGLPRHELPAEPCLCRRLCLAARVEDRRADPSRHARHLEWLPGKALALSAECWPEVVLGPLPVIYPFIVNNPGEAVQAKRRLGAVTIGHLTPPLSAAGLHGPLAELEGIIEEYAAADGLDRRRLRLPRRRDRRARLDQRTGRRLRPGRRASPTARPSPSSMPSSATSRSSASATACTSSAESPDEETMRLLAAATGAETAVRASADCERAALARRPRCTPRGAGTGRRAEPRPRRRAADRPQPHLDRSARHPDAHRRRDRRARRRRGGATLPAGSRRAAARPGDRSLGLGVAAHRRRRSCAGAVVSRREARSGTRPPAASPASRSCRWPCSTGRAST